MRKSLLLLFVAVLTLISVDAHAACWGVSEPPFPGPPSGDVCGQVDRIGFNGYYVTHQPAGTTNVKICPAGSAPSSYSCSTTSTNRLYDLYGNAVDAFRFPAYRPSYAGNADFDFYAWNVSAYWGSDTKPIRRITIGAGLSGIYIGLPPRPNPPTPVYPTGTNVPNSYLVRWKSGIDNDRKPYPVTYEIWFKYWPVNEGEPAQWTLSRAGMPCQDNGGGPDANNECSTFVAGPQSAGNWRWYVVANLNVSSQVDYRFTNTWFTTTTKTSSMYFVQPY